MVIGLFVESFIQARDDRSPKMLVSGVTGAGGAVPIASRAGDVELESERRAVAVDDSVQAVHSCSRFALSVLEHGVDTLYTSLVLIGMLFGGVSLWDGQQVGVRCRLGTVLYKARLTSDVVREFRCSYHGILRLRVV
jgi:hypothetical protein